MAVAARGHRAVPRVRGGCRETCDADLTLSSRTFREAAEEAGLSRLDGGIHFTEGNLAGQELGRRVGSRAWARAQAYIRDCDHILAAQPCAEVPRVIDGPDRWRIIVARRCDHPARRELLS